MYEVAKHWYILSITRLSVRKMGDLDSSIYSTNWVPLGISLNIKDMLGLVLISVSYLLWLVLPAL